MWPYQRTLAALTSASRRPAIVAALLMLATASACSKQSSSRAGTQPVPLSSASSSPVSPPARGSQAARSRSSVFGQATARSVDIYRGATSQRPNQQMPSPNADGAPAVFLLQGGQTPQRVQVLLPVRPNGGTGWVDRNQLRLFSTPYRLTISVGQHRLQEFRSGQLVATDPVGIGRGVTPTPSGTYYLTELLQPQNPNGPYGPYAYGLSAYSPVLTDFAGGPGQVGLHGTDDPAGIGGSVSHGCIRVDNSVITRLARTVPPGTPVTINQQ